MTATETAAQGALWLGDGRCRFRVWAPLIQQVEVYLQTPRERFIPMERQRHGYHQAVVEDVAPGSLYFYRLNGSEKRPDPTSRFQPQGVHGPSQVVDNRFDWRDAGWFGLPLPHYILYELHVGTFTPEGTFDAIIPHLDTLKELGVNALELMPIAQFPGTRNWGYDGVYLYAPQNSYGGPEGLRRLVNACHQKGLAVVLDVVYNHLGPEGNYLSEYAPYFTERYKTPWGSALNFDGPHCDEVRQFFVDNAVYWMTDFHIDALRLDAVHAIKDFSAQSILEELAIVTSRQAARLNRRFYLIAESNMNASRIIRSRELGGYGLDAQWNDDFHHALHTLLTGERDGYYADFGQLADLATSLREGFVYSGRYSVFLGRRHGDSPRHLFAHQFVICTQNHDQIGNRMLGERLTRQLSLDGLKLAAGVMLLSPFVPMLFMGEEYGETAPYPYFVSHSDPTLVEAVRKGRREEFADFAWQGEVPDPQAEATFQSAQLHHDLRQQGQHRALWLFYQELIRLRKTIPALADLNLEQMRVLESEKDQTLFWHRWSGADEVFVAVNFSDTAAELKAPLPQAQWHKLLDSTEDRWLGSGGGPEREITSDGEGMLRLPPKALVLYRRVEET